MEIVTREQLDSWFGDYKEEPGRRIDRLIREVHHLRVLLKKEHDARMGRSCLCVECQEEPSACYVDPLLLIEDQAR